MKCRNNKFRQNEPLIFFLFACLYKMIYRLWMIYLIQKPDNIYLNLVKFLRLILYQIVFRNVLMCNIRMYYNFITNISGKFISNITSARLNLRVGVPLGESRNYFPSFFSIPFLLGFNCTSFLYIQSMYITFINKQNIYMKEHTMINYI